MFVHRTIIAVILTVIFGGSLPNRAAAEEGCKKLVVAGDSTIGVLKQVEETGAVLGFVLAANPRWSTTARVAVGASAAAVTATWLREWFHPGETITLCPVHQGAETLYAVGDKQSVADMVAKINVAPAWQTPPLQNSLYFNPCIEAAILDQSLSSEETTQHIIKCNAKLGDGANLR
jgi:hypothetical protein